MIPDRVTLYYARTITRNGVQYLKGDYACEVTMPVAEMAMARSPGTFCFYEDIDQRQRRNQRCEWDAQLHANFRGAA